MRKDLRNTIRKIIIECSCEEPEVEPVIDVSNIMSSDLMHNKYLKVVFQNSEGRNLTLFVPVQSFSTWYNTSKPTGNVLNKFVNEFVKSSPVEDEELMKEIVNEFGDLICNEDTPNNSTNSMVGKSKFGTDKTIRQTVARMKNYDANMGRGIVTW